ncbi:urease accessory protein ureF [Rubidibacter lacunae KORDI 51-2]|uniref:Urease accessory protein UreF n=1 Tax=Rubidibacter lacunae KORDI 51-2 TaxID=582515 RepID=U5DGA0_9CHRO|nr:urease accessory protein UreF [Rubidibacter lacunae]ERN40302.1 urease accessory protein ureF [Rubidibacter lacunae KORDI 51-2]
MDFPPPALLSLLQLASPALPVGAFGYSEGLEALVASGTIDSRDRLTTWLSNELETGAVRVEAAVMLRARAAADCSDMDRLNSWNVWLAATRETDELHRQSAQMGGALLRLLQDLEPDIGTNASALVAPCQWAIAYGIAAARWAIAPNEATLGFLHGWATNLIGAGVKLVPLGQTAGQQVLRSLQQPLVETAQTIGQLGDDELESCSWGLALASSTHETQYSRLFRS